MGISLQYKAVCDRCGEKENVGAEIHRDTIATTEMPEGWSKSLRNAMPFYLCTVCTNERNRLDDIHSVQVAAWHDNKLTKQSIEYLSQWTYGLRDPVKLEPEAAYNPHCLTGALDPLDV